MSANFKNFQKFFLFKKDILTHYKDIWRHLKTKKKKFVENNINYEVYLGWKF